MSDEFNPIAGLDLMDNYEGFLSNLPEEYDSGLAQEAFFAGAKAMIDIIEDIEPKTEEEIKRLFDELKKEFIEFK